MQPFWTTEAATISMSGFTDMEVIYEMENPTRAIHKQFTYDKPTLVLYLYVFKYAIVNYTDIGMAWQYQIRPK